jgi:multidrug efflux pump subunit AcrA (membrane-fusion protein)
VRTAVAVAGLLAALALAAGCAGSPPPPATTAGARVDARRAAALTVRRGTLEQRQLLSGSLVALRGARYRAPFTNSWRMTLKWLIDEGTPVRPGDPIARLDPTSLGAELESLQLGLEGKRQEREVLVASGRRDQIEAELALRRATIALEKATLQAQVPEAMVGTKDYRQRQLERDSATRNRQQALLGLSTQATAHQARLARLALEIRALEESLARNQSGLEAMTIRADTVGSVLYGNHPWYDRKVRAGDTVTPSQTIAEIPDPSSLVVEAWANEADSHLIEPGQSAELRLDAFPERPFPGRVTSVSPAGEEREIWGRSRWFRVLISIDAPDLAVARPGMSVRASVRGAPQQRALLVPIEAVRVHEGRFLVTPAGGSAQREIRPLGADGQFLAVADDGTLAEGTLLLGALDDVPHA